MSARKSIKRKSLVPNSVLEPLPLDVSVDVQNQIQKLQMEVDILKEAINVLKKDPGTDTTILNNREMAVIVSALIVLYKH